MSKTRREKEKQPKPIAVTVADLHLTLNRPACRNDEDWMETQARYLTQVKLLAKTQRKLAHKILLESGEDSEELLNNRPLPILCAGDVFDKSNAAPELINFALKHLPNQMICVPGQHDLPNHRTDEMHRSGYGVLVEAGKIIHLGKDRPCHCPDEALLVYGFGWGQKIIPPDMPEYLKPPVTVALVHRFVWMEGYHYKPGLKTVDADHPRMLKKELKGYDVAVFGDNHRGFSWSSGGLLVYNCGGFIRRKSDEMEYVPSVGVLYDDGSIVRTPLNTDLDKFHLQPEKAEKVEHDMKAFLEKLEKLGEHGLNFREAVRRHAEDPSHNIPSPVREIILECLDS